MTNEMQTQQAIWTIGHSTRSLTELIDLLVENRVETLIDVRSFPGSRKYPHFNKERLNKTIPSAGVEYVHLSDLGGRRKTNKDSPNTTWRNLSFRSYADHMETTNFEQGIYRLEEIAASSRVCYMCSEAVWWRCHRSMISDYLASRAWRVLHILGVGSTKGHTYTQPAKIVNGRLSYRP